MYRFLILLTFLGVCLAQRQCVRSYHLGCRIDRDCCYGNCWRFDRNRVYGICRPLLVTKDAIRTTSEATNWTMATIQPSWKFFELRQTDKMLIINKDMIVNGLAFITIFGLNKIGAYPYFLLFTSIFFL